MTDGHKWVLRAMGIYFHSSGDEQPDIHVSVVLHTLLSCRGEASHLFSLQVVWAYEHLFPACLSHDPPYLYVSLNLSRQTPVTKSEITLWEQMLGPISFLQLGTNRITWEGEFLFEELPPSEWPVGIYVWYFFILLFI